MAGVVQQPDVVDRATCELLIDVYESCAGAATFCDHHGHPIVTWSQREMPRTAKAAISSIASRCLELTASTVSDGPIYPETVILAAIGDGHGHAPHADNERLSNGSWVPNHTPQRDHVGILYLNSEFTGGELCFESSEEPAIRPVPGLYVTFACTRDFVHEVTPVTSGRRYSMALWFTRRLASADIAMLCEQGWMPGDFARL